MAVLRHSPQAETDLETILEELQQQNPDAAERQATAFYEKGQLLAQFPELGRLRPEIAPQIRSTLVQPYVIFYRVVGDEIHILRILHGKRDLRRIMQSEADD
jgi:toxin ParE1/3/4